MSVSNKGSKDGAVAQPQPQHTPVSDDQTLPTYEAHDAGIENTIIELMNSAGTVSLPIRAYPELPRYQLGPLPEEIQVQQKIIETFFRAVRNKQDEVVALLIEQNFVTPNTTDSMGQTPLLVAVAAGNVRMVQELVDFGAEIDGYGVGAWKRPSRTPLQLAASMGNLTLVKLFIEVFHADDSLIAPDGQLALRLAIDNGHREVADYLPLRRGGGWRRWKAHHAKAMARIKIASMKMYHFFKFFLWYTPKFLVWDAPKHVLVMPLRDAIVWTWKNCGRFLPWCKKQAQEMPGRFKRAGKWVWAKVKAIPKGIAHSAKETWAFFTETLPKELARFWRYLVSLVTVRIPKALSLVAQWLWDGATSIGHWIASVAMKTISLLHTVFSAIASFFRQLTLKDIWNGFYDLLHTIFIAFPMKLWSWICKLGELSHDVLKALFGLTGQIVWAIGWVLQWIVLYVPKKLWIILSSIGSSIANGWMEVLVWINPKR